jgi:hypothetical protein
MRLAWDAWRRTVPVARSEIRCTLSPSENRPVSLSMSRNPRWLVRDRRTFAGSSRRSILRTFPLGGDASRPSPRRSRAAAIRREDRRRRSGRTPHQSALWRRRRRERAGTADPRHRRPIASGQHECRESLVSGALLKYSRRCVCGSYDFWTGQLHERARRRVSPGGDGRNAATAATAMRAPTDDHARRGRRCRGALVALALSPSAPA